MRFLKILTSFFLFLIFSYIWHSKQPKLPSNPCLSIVVTIKPIHGLVSAVAEGVLTPQLLMDKGVSPHSHSLSADEIKTLRNADFVIWIGEIYETHLKEILEKTVPLPKIFTLSEKAGLTLYPYRQESLWEGEFQEAHEHHSDDSILHDGHSHSPHTIDGHLWLDPNNAIAIVNEVAKALSTIDPLHSEKYQSNAAQTVKKIKDLTNKTKERLKPIIGKPYLLYHDAMQYFDHYFGTKAIGAITTEPGHPPKAKHFARLKVLLGNKSSAFHPACIFTEPQFENDVSINLAKQFSMKYHMLDYLGQDIAAGPQSYFEIMSRMTDDLLKGLS